MPQHGGDKRFVASMPHRAIPSEWMDEALSCSSSWVANFTLHTAELIWKAKLL